MEILTLLKANIRRKKGSFVSVILLTLIISISVTTILSIKESAFSGIENAHEICDTPDVFALYRSNDLTDDLVEKIKSDDRVKYTDTADFIFAQKSKIGNENYNNTMLLTRCDESTKLIDSDLKCIEENAPELQKGEIYVPQGLLTNLNGKIGDKITINTLDGDHEFLIKGILFEPIMGASVIGYKNSYIGDDDFSEIVSSVSEAETEDKHGLGKSLKIYKADNCTLTNGQFRRQLNLDMNVTNMAVGSLTKDMSIHYTKLFPEIVSSVLIVFVMFLLVIVVIVTVHSISVEIETNYATFGVLKAQGFDKNKIRKLFLFQYLLAEMIGAILGVTLSIPLIKLTSNIFVTITAIPAVTSVPAGIIAIILLALFLLSAVSIFFVTIKINKISPVKAISGAKKDIYFDSRMNAPISKKFLSPSLALRQFTSAKRRYAGTLAIVAILVLFMMTITVLANVLNSRSALESMGAIVSDIDISTKENLSDNDYKMIENEIENFSKIKKSYHVINNYFSFDGEEMMCCISKDASIFPVLKGRSPIYDNEIAVSPILLDEFNLKIGDEVMVGQSDKKESYIISGTYQTMNDVGRAFLMSYSAAEKIGFDEKLWSCYLLEETGNKALNQKIADALNEKFSDKIEAKPAEDLMDDTFDIAISTMQMIIYVFSVLFSLVVTHMVCSKAFIQERTDIGIYKAIGFTSKNLRFQFAVRFLMVSLIGSAVGSALSVMFSGKLLSTLLYGIGITQFSVEFTAFTFVAPIALICVCFFIFAYFVSRKIKNVAVRELVVE